MSNIVMYFPKNFFLKQSIDRTLKKLANAGLIQYWINRYVDKRYLQWENSSTEPLQTQVIHLHGAFIIGFIGLGFSTFIFVLEILWTRTFRKFSSQNLN